MDYLHDAIENTGTALARLTADQDAQLMKLVFRSGGYLVQLPGGDKLETGRMSTGEAWHVAAEKLLAKCLFISTELRKWHDAYTQLVATYSIREQNTMSAVDEQNQRLRLALQNLVTSQEISADKHRGAASAFRFASTVLGQKAHNIVPSEIAEILSEYIAELSVNRPLSLEIAKIVAQYISDDLQECSIDLEKQGNLHTAEVTKMTISQAELLEAK